MNRPVKSSHSKRWTRVLFAAIVTCYLCVLPSCSIPKPRWAEPGPELPQCYQDANNWHYVGAPAAGNGDAIQGNAPNNSDNSDATAGNFSGPLRFVNYLRPVSLEDPANLNNENTYSDDASSTVDAVPLGTFGAAANTFDQNPPPVISDPGPGLEPIPLGSVVGPADANIAGSGFENSSCVPWFQFFNDPFLTGLIEQALVGNQELKILAEEIEVAANEVQARSGEYLPFVRFGAAADVRKPSLFTREGAIEEQLEIRSGHPFPVPLPDFLVATNVSWEIDIWRKLRNARDAAALRYLGTADGRNYIVTRMVAEVAENYYELLALDNRLEILNQTIEIQERSLETAKLLKAGARGTELGVQRFQAEVRKNQSERLIIAQRIVEAENRINFLVGRYPQPVQRMSVNYIDLNLQALSAGVPADLLRNRSDIRQAERDLEAAGLDLQVAKARFYPSMSLFAGVGYRAFNPEFLFLTPESLIYYAAGDLVAPLINKRAIKAAYLSANAKQLQSVYNYQRTVLTAYTEVINYMAKAENYRRSIEIKKQQLAALESSVDVATKLFQNARAEYVDVLLSQRDMLEAKTILIETKQQQLSAVVNTYQALGGGGSFE